MDPSNQSRLRELCTRAFGRDSVATIGATLQPLAQALLEEGRRTGGMDGVADFAAPIALTAASIVVGIPSEHTEPFHRLTHRLTGRLLSAVASDPTSRSSPDGFAELYDLLRNLLTNSRRESSEASLITALMRARGEGDAMTDDEAVAFLLFFLFAAHENITNFLGSALYTLLQHPSALEQIHARPELIPGAVEELLRYEAPVQFMMMKARHEIDLDGTTIGPGDCVLLGIGAANRDPARFHDPDRFEITRSGNQHLSFGYGPLTCIGASLARLEAQIALAAIAPYSGSIAIGKPVRWREAPPVLRGVESLPLLLRTT
jgi:cytochrome P450